MVILFMAVQLTRFPEIMVLAVKVQTVKKVAEVVEVQEFTYICVDRVVIIYGTGSGSKIFISP